MSRFQKPNHIKILAKKWQKTSEGPVIDMSITMLNTITFQNVIGAKYEYGKEKFLNTLWAAPVLFFR
jgi:hypothetical protein